MPEEIEGIPLSNPSLQLCFGEIALDDLRRLSVLLDKNNRRGAAAERFNSKCAAARGEAEVDGTAVTASSICFFFCFARSFFPPPKKLLIILLRSRPTSLSIRFVLGRSIVPPT